MIRSPLIGEALLPIRHVSLIGTAKAPRFAFKRRERCSANTVGTTSIEVFRLLGPELAYKFSSTDRKRKYGKDKMKVNQNEKIMSSDAI